ncbi:MAG TPA: DUF3606 domain-containing protein [Usitatibacter sp.]|jgi:hypothetical protein|nr:DUF3606 domain-containing protein [Usitatibacter sp.]
MKLQLDSEIDSSDVRDVEAWAEAFDVFGWHIEQAVRTVGANALSVKNYLFVMGHLGARSSSRIQDRA